MAFETISEQVERANQQARFFMPENNLTEAAAENYADFKTHERARVAVGAAERIRLVKAAKCPTEKKTGRIDKDTFLKAAAFEHLMGKVQPEKLFVRSEKFGWVKSVETHADLDRHVVVLKGHKYNLADMAKSGELVSATGRTKIEGAGRFTVVSHREWSGEYKIRTQVEQPAESPPLQSGARITKDLSMRGAVAISDSCHYVEKKYGGYSTFLTLTFDDESRKRIVNCESTIQKEASRFFDGIQKMYQRGWQAKTDFQSVKMPANDHKLKYCWVAENPKNAAGEDNPHLHILMKWRVPFAIFDAWSKRIEGIWGQGFAHLEKIKQPEQAGAYMAKAAGYMTKAAGATDQGEIRGNRYGISEDARAPEWALVGRYELGVMGHLIADVYDYFGFKYGPKFKIRKKLNRALNAAKETAKELKDAKQRQTPEQLKRRSKIGQMLQKVRAEINELPAVSSKYQILIKSKSAFDEFWAWATNTEKGKKFEWLPTINEDETWQPYNKPDSLWFGEYKKRIGLRRRRFCEVGAAWWQDIYELAQEYLPLNRADFEAEYDEYLTTK